MAPSFLRVVAAVLPIALLLVWPAPAGPAEPLADLVPTALKLGALTTTPGATTSVQITVSNRGTATADWVAVTFSWVSGATTSWAARVNVGTLVAGASGTVATTLTALTRQLELGLQDLARPAYQNMRSIAD